MLPLNLKQWMRSVTLKIVQSDGVAVLRASPCSYALRAVYTLRC